MGKMFRPKKVPFFTKGRFMHAAFGMAAVAVFGFGAHFLQWGTFSEGAQWGIVFAFIYGVIWEMLTPVLAVKFNWAHPFGDFIDLMAYYGGALLVAVPLIYLKFLG